MQQVIIDALTDSLKALPLLLIIYIGIEIIEWKYGTKIRERVAKAGKAGPTIGAVAGILPQCGFSVIAAALFSQRLVTIGTLLAVFLATSDEAIPIILANPEKMSLVWPLIITKLIIAVIAGYAIDIIFFRKNRKVLHHLEEHEEGDCHRNHSAVLEEKACCGHSLEAKKLDLEEIITHPIIHTLKIFLFIFGVSFLLNWLFFAVGKENVAAFLGANSVWQPFAAVLLGLVPNCASSVALTELYLNNAIGFGAVIAGLSAAGGLGLLVLLKENKNKKETALIIGLLVAISLLAGLFIQYFL